MKINNNNLLGGVNIYNDAIALKQEFNRIKQLGWIKSMRAGKSGIGYTFETLINKPEENFEIPDYGSIEIKTKTNYSQESIKLFSATPDGDELFAIQTLREKFGYPDKENNNLLVFNGIVNGKTFTPIGNHYLFKLRVDNSKQVVRLIIIDINCNLVSDNISWTFKMLEEKLKRKLTYLAIINANKKVKSHETYYNYVNINFYKLKSFYAFITLIDKGIIKVNFSIGTYKNGQRKGQIHDHGTKFAINEKDIPKLYDKVIL